eukprot:1347617-Alexandrium_andersonii.AAC.1
MLGRLWGAAAPWTSRCSARRATATPAPPQLVAPALTGGGSWGESWGAVAPKRWCPCRCCPCSPWLI